MIHKKPDAIATAIGSFPHTKVEDALSLIFDKTPDLPVWPQLPKFGIYEDFNNQFSGRLPSFFINEAEKKSGFNSGKNFPEELNKFYTRVLEDDLEYFKIEEKSSAGFSAFIKGISLMDRRKIYAIKGQTVGPLTHGVIPDKADGKFAIYKPDLFDAIIKNGTMTARWQVKKLKKSFPHVVMFIDEPSLSIIGSGFYSVEHDFAINSFKEIVRGILDEGGIPGLHCCGNADWEELLNLDIDIINFDASDPIVADKFINSANLNEYLEKGKLIAWGIVPTFIEKIEKATYADIEKTFHGLIKECVKKGLRERDVLSQSIITPSCGTGTLSVQMSEKAMDLTKKLSDNLRGV